MELLQVCNLIELSENFIKNALHSGFSDGHDFDHTCRVVKHALALCREIPEADRTVVHLAAILHDVARPQEFQSKGSIDHAAAGAAIARDFLIQYTSQEIADHVAQAISQHRFRSGDAPQTIEAKILYDADKLDSLGAVGIARAFMFAAKAGAKLHNSAQDALAGNAYSSEDTAYREYLVKLSKLPEKMLTAPGKHHAQKLSAFMKTFFNQLNAEIFN